VRWLVELLEGADVRAGRAVLTPADHLIHRGGRTAKGGLDAAVATIADPAF
jgi:hypothetical protein